MLLVVTACGHVQHQAPDGYEFTIRTPGTPERGKQYDAELRHLWEELTRRMRSKNADDRDTVTLQELVLKIYFYWANDGALTRGTAALGFAVLVALCAACGLQVL